MTVRMKIGLAVLAAFAVLGGIGGFVFGRYWIDNREPNFSKDYVLYVYPETTAEQVMDSLAASAGTIRPKSLERAFAKMGTAESMKPGRYVVDASVPSIYVARMLVYGWQTPQNMTLSGTLRKKDRIAQRIGSQMMVDSASVAAALNDEAFLAKYGFTPENVFALILPDTYEMYWTASVEEIFDRFNSSRYVIDGIPELLRELDLLGIRTAIISNNMMSSESLALAVKRRIPSANFEFCLTSADILFAKPSKNIFNAALNYAGINACECWYCGDGKKPDVFGADRRPRQT